MKAVKIFYNMTKNLILFNGGESDEHEITLLSYQYLKETIQEIPNYQTHEVMISKKGYWTYYGKPCHLEMGNILRTERDKITIHGALPYLHGHPGETGHLLALLELYKIPYLGSSQESAVLTFNKISTKLWLQASHIPTTPGIAINDLQHNSIERATMFFRQHGAAFVKASNQGSSRGCYFAEDEKQLKTYMEKALSLSPYALIEKPIVGRELEVAIYEYQDELRATAPGEIIPPSHTFYDYEEKYSKATQTQILTKSKELPEGISRDICSYALQAFKLFKISDLARIDFFYSQTDGLIINEINTFPGLTSISLFPRMLQQDGLCFKDFLLDRLQKFPLHKL